MTFQNFMSRFREVDLPIGDLARDMQDDPNFPESKVLLKSGRTWNNPERAMLL